MSLENLYLRLTHLSTTTGAIYLHDVNAGFLAGDTGSRDRKPANQAGTGIYVPYGSSVYLPVDGTVLLSHERGCIRQMVDGGYIRATPLGGATVDLVWAYDAAVDGGAINTTYTLTNVLSATKALPTNLLAIRGWVEVVTAFVGLGASLSVGVTGTVAAFRAATAVGTLTDNAVLPFNGSVVHNGTDLAAPVATRITAATSVVARVTGGTFTAGKVFVHLECLASPE